MMAHRSAALLAPTQSGRSAPPCQLSPRRAVAASRCGHVSPQATVSTGDGEGTAAGGPMMRRVRRGVAAAVAVAISAAVVGGPMLQPPTAQAITGNNLLFLEAWRAVRGQYP